MRTLSHSTYYIVLVLAVHILSGCSSRKSPEDLFSENRSGVVLIYNRYYYQMKLPNGQFIYFTGMDQDGDIDFALEKDDIEEPASMYGTGFFISERGTIMTNRHVVQPFIDKSIVKNKFNSLLTQIKDYLSYCMNELRDEYANLENEKKQCLYYDYYGNIYSDEQKLKNIESKQSELEQQFNEIRDYRDQIMNGNLSLDELKIEPICQIGIAYDDTHVNSEDDFLSKNPCTTIKISESEDVDLALIQLNSKKTPETAHVFSIKEQKATSITDRAKAIFGGKEEDELHINQELYMIGYNAGPLLAKTKHGIEVQMTSGKVTQLPDGDRLLYSIPTVQGSSGSPVIDENGRLVAVNFAKLAVGDNFNFGIPLNKIMSFAK